jgi:hypothetical protein
VEATRSDGKIRKEFIAIRDASRILRTSWAPENLPVSSIVYTEVSDLPDDASVKRLHSPGKEVDGERAGAPALIRNIPYC